MYVYVRKMQKKEELIQKEDMPILIKKIIQYICIVFNIAIIENIDKEHCLIAIPKINDKKVNRMKLKYKNSKIYFSRSLKKYQDEYKNDNLVKEFLEKVIYFIIKHTEGIKLEMQNIYFLVNEYNRQNIEIIEQVLKKTKTINVITKNLEKYIEYEEKLYKDKGILISVTNNKRKSLKNAKIIINLDFNEEQINMFSINRNCILINCSGEQIRNIKYFEGTIVNNIETDISEIEEIQYLYKDFEKNDLYISFKNKFISYNVGVKSLVGNNGKISKKELQNLQKILDKC